MLRQNKYPNIFLISLAATLTLLASSCATTSAKKFSEMKEGEWHAKVLVHDKKAGHSGIVNVDIKAINGERLRLDVTSTMGSFIASMAMNQTQLDYVNASEKTLYHSKPTPRAVQAILQVPLEPNLFFNILFDQLPTGKNWDCTTDANSMPKMCKDTKTNLTISWTRRAGESRTVEIDHPLAQLQMNLFDFVGHIGDAAKAFDLKVPSSFKVKKLGYGPATGFQSRSETIGRN
jgi:hypothetical protein